MNRELEAYVLRSDNENSAMGQAKLVSVAN